MCDSTLLCNVCMGCPPFHLSDLCCPSLSGVCVSLVWWCFRTWHEELTLMTSGTTPESAGRPAAAGCTGRPVAANGGGPPVVEDAGRPTAAAGVAIPAWPLAAGGTEELYALPLYASKISKNSWQSRRKYGAIGVSAVRPVATMRRPTRWSRCSPVDMLACWDTNVLPVYLARQRQAGAPPLPVSYPQPSQLQAQRLPETLPLPTQPHPSPASPEPNAPRAPASLSPYPNFFLQPLFR